MQLCSLFSCLCCYVTENFKFACTKASLCFSLSHIIMFQGRTNILQHQIFMADLICQNKTNSLPVWHAIDVMSCFSCQALAKELVRSSRAVNRLYENKAQLNSVSMHLGEIVGMIFFCWFHVLYCSLKLCLWTYGRVILLVGFQWIKTLVVDNCCSIKYQYLRTGTSVCAICQFVF